MKRFITEYANYMKNEISNNDLMQNDIKQKALERIEQVVNARKRMFISIGETMEILSNPF